MRRAAALAWAPIVLATLALAGCGGPGGDEGRILGVLGKARGALVADRAAELCGLLTVHGQARSLAFAVGGAVAPQSCEQVVDADWRADAADQVSQFSWRDAVSKADFTVERITGAQAAATMKFGALLGPSIDITLLKTPDGWRVDDVSGVAGVR